MYTKEQLLKYPYFEEIFKSRDVSSVVDSLTGLISRRYMLEFIQDLIEKKIPFSLALLDLDNFKFINDTYGHKTGDGVLSEVASDLIKYLEDYGVAGRYGGDEFLIVNFKYLSYDELKVFYTGIYYDYNVLRKNIHLGEYEPFITGTLGSATFPADAQDYETLFGLADKTLYRGKTKGRNCYIIYVEEKHKNLSIKELASRGMYNIFHELSCKFDAWSKLSDKLKAMLDILADDMRISDLYYVGSDNHFRNVSACDSLGQITDLDKLIKNDIYTTNDIKDIESKSRSVYELCKDKEFETVLFIRIGIQDETFGYLVCAEPRNRRIWQDDEYAIMFFVARMLAVYIQASGDKI
ncbi:MAG: GGDEF domain-containing protein [Lachnospiraceae bacterium]|nr:GGDEF domain-containing protein [Lachnospiraceae bacterium]